MHSQKQLATVIDQVIDETIEKEETSSADKCKQLNEKCDIVLEKVKSKKARLKQVIEIK
jgi:hypothetical protein